MNCAKFNRIRRRMDLEEAVALQSTQLLAALLRQAAKEHHVFEESLGQEDDDWADWYAQFILGRISVPSDNTEEVPTDVA